MDWFISNLKINGFRRLNSLDMEMRPLMVLIGANGIGKTSFLNAISLLSSSAMGELEKKLSSLGGLSNVLTLGKANELSYHVTVHFQEQKPFEYELSLARNHPNFGYAIVKELLAQNNGDNNENIPYIISRNGSIVYFNNYKNAYIVPDWNHNFSETVLSQEPKSLLFPENVRTMLATSIYHHGLDVGDLSPIRLPQQMKPAYHPGRNGEDLLPYLYTLRENDSHRYDSIIDTLRAAYPSFDSLAFPSVAAGMLAMRWKDKNFPDPFYMNMLSDGTLRFLWLVSVLHSPIPYVITMIDEPELSLHPELLGLLVDLMRETSKRTQLIVATHSDRLVRFLKPSEIVAMDCEEDGTASTKWADTMDLDSWLAEYSMDEIWSMGQLGACS